MRRANKFGKNVKAMSVTWSIDAITTGDQEAIKSRAFNSKECLPLGREDAIKANNKYVSISIFLPIMFFDGRYPAGSSRLPSTSASLGLLTLNRFHTVSARKSPNKPSGSSRGGETCLPDHRFHADFNRGTDVAALRNCEEDQLQQLADQRYHEQQGFGEWESAKFGISGMGKLVRGGYIPSTQF